MAPVPGRSVSAPRNRVLPRRPATTPRCLSNECRCRDIASRSRNVCCGCSTNLHNHPSGDPKPSCDDIEMAREIAKAAEALDISIHDHLVIKKKKKMGRGRSEPTSGRLLRSVRDRRILHRRITGPDVQGGRSMSFCRRREKARDRSRCYSDRPGQTNRHDARTGDEIVVEVAQGGATRAGDRGPAKAFDVGINQAEPAIG